MIARVLFLAFATSVAGASSASAHAQLVRTEPGVGSTVAAPSRIILHFSESVVPGFCGVAITDAAGLTAKTGKPSGKGADLTVPVSGLRAGSYTVRWHAVSVDTHKTQGSFRFTVAP